MKRQEKDEKFHRILFSDLFLPKLTPLLISRNKATTKMLLLLQKGHTTTELFI